MQFLASVLTLFLLMNYAANAKDKELNLNDLGFTQDITKSDPDKDRLLETRSSKLKTHQTLGLATAGLMIATALTAKEGGVTNTHKTLGILTGVSYFSTAYFSITAPDTPVEGQTATNVKIHKTLAYIHFPLMVLTPIAGLMAEKQYERGEKLHGLAKQKGTLATATLLTFLPAAATILIEF